MLRPPASARRACCPSADTSRPGCARASSPSDGSRSISAVRRVPTSSPLRSTGDAVADLEHLAEPVGDVDDDLPSALSARSALKMRSISTSDSVAVGSSRMSTRASRVSMRASSTSCRRPMLSCDTGVSSGRSAETDLCRAPHAPARGIPCGDGTAAPCGCRARCCPAPTGRAQGSAPAPPARCRAPGRAAGRGSRSACRQPERCRRRPDARR